MGDNRRLTRSLTDRVFGGVCGGIAVYTGINPLWLRLLFVLLAPTTSGFGLLIYVVLWLTMPVETLDDLLPLAPAGAAPPRPRGSSTGQLALGLAAVAAGVLLLVVHSDLLSVPPGDFFWPACALALGGALLWRQLRGV
jgi:phage shock protein PspC (stress-responsive transcriptional regulator)